MLEDLYILGGGVLEDLYILVAGVCVVNNGKLVLSSSHVALGAH